MEKGGAVERAESWRGRSLEEGRSHEEGRALERSEPVERGECIKLLLCKRVGLSVDPQHQPKR